MDNKRKRKIEDSLKQQAAPAKTKAVGANREKLEAAARAASNRVTSTNRNAAAALQQPVRRQSPMTPAANAFRPVGSMTQEDYAAAARAFMANNTNVPQNTRTVGTPANPALQGMYDMTQEYINAGGPAHEKTYGQLMQQYYANAPTSAEAYDRIMRSGGYGAMTGEQLAAMTSSDVYYPTQAPGNPEADVNAWEWMTDADTRDATRLAYMNQMADIQMATASGAFDNAEYLFTNPDYVSDDYLAYMQANLPGMIEEERARYEEEMAGWNIDNPEFRASVDRAGRAINDASMSYGNVPAISMMYQMGDYYPEDEPAYYAQEFERMAGADYDRAVEALLMLDGGFSDRAMTREEFDALDEDSRGAELRRMVSQYVPYVLQGESYMPAAPSMYPYEDVLELVDNEVQSRAVMRGFIAPVVGDPNVYEMSRYDPAIWYDDDSYMDYYNVNADVSEGNIFSYMTDVERAVYNYYYNQGNLEQASAYLSEMEPVLLNRDRIMDRVGWDFMATDNAFTGALSWGAARVTNLEAGLSYPIEAAATLMGFDNGLPNMAADYTATVGTAQERVLGELGGPQILGRNPWQWAYTGLTSTADMGLAIGAGALTGVNPLYVMAAEAAGADLASTAGSDYSPVERVFRSLATGGAEILTEKLPLDILTSDALAPGYIWRTILSEAAEEGVSEIAGIGIDLIASYVAGHESEVEGEYKRLRMLGYEDAGSRVMSSLAQQVAAAGLGGAIGGGMMGGTSYVANTAVNYGSGHDVVEAGNRAKLIELGLAMSDTTNSFRLANALADAAGEDGTGRISLARVGQLYNTMLAETAEQYHDDVHQMGVESVADAIAQRYSDLGLENEMETRYTTEELAEAIVKTAETGTEPGGAIGRYIREHRVTAEIMREFREGGSPWAETMRTRQAAAGLQAQIRTAQIKATKIKAEGGTETETNTETDADAEVTHEGIMTDEGIEAETTEEVRRLTRRMSTSELLSRSIVLGLEGGVEEQTELVRVERTEDGLSLVVDRGGEEVNVGLDDVAQVSGAGVARVLAYAQERKEVTAQEINDMIGLLETSGEGFKSSRLISLYESALNAGFFGEARDTLNYLLEGAGEATDAMRAVLEVGYRQGQMQQSQAEENRLRRRADKETTGKSKLVSFMGDVGADFKGIDTGVRRSVHELMGTMDEAQEAAVDVIGQVAKAVGVQVVLYRTMAENGQKVDAPNGFYDAASNAIFVDINSGIAQGGQELVNYTVMHTFAHELTHYIEHNAADGYKTLRGLVQTVMAAKDGETNYAGLVMNKLREGTNLTSRAAAEAEVIADACELMLRNTTAIKTLAEQNITLAAKVRNFVANFAAKIRRAFAGLVLNTKESALLTEMRDGVITYVDGLQAAWDNALIEAANRNRVRSEMTGQNQTDGTQQGKLSESEGINAELEAPMKLEAPSKDWHPELDEGWDRGKMPRLVTHGGEVQENAMDMAAEQGSTERAEGNTEAPIELEAPRKGGYLERTAGEARGKMPRLVTRAGEVQQATADAEAENAAGLAEAYDSQITRAATGEGMSRTFEGWATEPGQGAMPFDRDTTLSMAAEIARAATEVLNTLQSPDQLGDDANADDMTQAEETARQSALDAAREMVNSVYEGNDAAIREKLTALAGNVAEEAVNAWMVIRARVAARAARAARQYSERKTFVPVDERDAEYFHNIDTHADIVVTHASGIAEREGAEGNLTWNDIEEALQNNPTVNTIKGRKVAYCPDLGMKVQLTRKGLMHYSDIKKAKGESKAEEDIERSHRVAMAMPQLLQNAVEVNRSMKKATATRPYAHVMMAVYEEAGEYYAVRIVIEHNTDISTGELLQYDVVGQVHATNAKRIPRPNGLVPRKNAVLPRRQGGILAYNVSQLIRDVKGINAFGDTFAKKAYEKVGEKRFETKFSQNLQYSERRPSNVSIRNALKNMRETEDMSETEKILLRKYKEDLAEFEGYQEQINQLVEEMKAEQTEEEKKKNKNRMQVLKVKQRRVHGRLTKAESSEGFARMMATTAGMIRMFVRNDSIQAAAEDASRRLNEIADELNRLNATFDRTKRWEMQRVMQSIYDPKALDEAAVGLKSMFNSNMSKTAIKERLVSLSMAMISGTNVDGLTPLQQAEKLARDLRTGTVIDEDGILEMLRENLPTIEINNAMREELKARGISLQSFKSVVGKVAKVVYKKDGNSSGLLAQMEADTYYRENGALHAFFGEIINDADAYAKLYDTVSNVLTSGDRIYEGRYGEETMQGDIVAVLDAMTDAKMLDAGVETVQAVYDAVQRTAQTDSRLAERIAELKRKSAGTNVIAKKVAGELSDIGIEAPMVAKYYATLEAERRLLTEQETTEEIRKRMEGEMGAWYQERQLMDELRKTRGNIRRMVGWMDKRIRNEKAGKLVQEELKPVVEEMVRILLKAQGEEIFHTFNEKELGEIARVYTALHALDGDNTKQLNELLRRDMQQTLDNLKYDLKQLGEVEEDTRIARMNAEYNILAQIEDLITEIWHAVNETNNLYIEGRKVQLEVVGEKMGRELRSKGRHSIKDSLGGKARQTLTRFVRDGNITPPYFFRMLEVDTLSELNSGLLSAQSRYARMKDSAEAKIAELQKKYNYWEWKNNESLTFTTELGQRLGGDLHKITLTVDEALSLWAIWQREMGSTPLFTSTHLAKGGFVLESKQRKVNGRIETDSTAHKLSTLDMQTINNWLTPEMKEYAKKVVEYMSKDMAAVGNQTSMHLYGVKKFKEQKYFPMRTQRDQLVQSSDAGAKAENDSNRLAHKSFTKPRVNMAATPLQVGSFTATAAGHINDMLLYGTFAEPIEAFNSVLNYMVTEMDGDDTNLYSIRSMFEQAFGADMKKYLERYLADANGGVRPEKTSTEVVANKMLSTFKKTATMASLSVAAQQPMAIIRAATEIDLKYFTAGRISKKEYEQLRKYSGTALIKESGGFDMTGTRSMAEQIMGTPEEDYKLWQTFKSAFGVGTPKGERAAIAGRQWDKLFGLAAQKADQATWTYLWGVVKAEMADAHKGMNVNSPEFLELAGKRFDEVVNLTQVYDSTLVRSPNMRSKGMMQYAMTFRAEPTLTLNLLLDAWRKQPDRAKKIVKASAVYIVSAIVTSLAAAIPSAGRDDEEKPWAEKLLEEWGNRLGGWGGNLNPAGLVPIVGDVMSIFDGYDVERADMAVIADMFKEIQRIGSGYYKDKPWKGVENAVGAVGNMLGIPAKNLWREARAAWNTVTGIIDPPREMSTMGLMHDASLNYVVLPDRDNGYYFNRLYNSMQDGKTEDVERVTEFLTGVMGKKATAVKTGVKDVVKAKLLAGKITEAEAKAFLVKHGLVKDEKEAYKAVDEWLDKDANRDEAGDLPEDYEYTVFRGLYEALEGGNAQAIKAETDKLTSNGWEADDVRDKIREYVNKEYREGRMPQEEAKRLLQAYGEYTTYEDENDWYWHFEGQDYRTENGTESTFSRYGALHTAIDGGKSTEIKAAVKQLTDNGYTEEKVQSEVYSYLGEQYMDGKIRWAQLMSLAKQYGGKGDNDENDWYWAKRKYEYGKANGGKTTGYGQYSDYLEAVRTAKNLRNVTKDYLDHGVEKGTLKKQLRGAFREEYRALYRTNRTQFANLRANLVNALVVMGETRDNAMKYLDGWLED